MAGLPEDSTDSKLELGHHGVGDNCSERVLDYAGKGLLAGEPRRPEVGCALFGVFPVARWSLWVCRGVLFASYSRVYFSSGYSLSGNHDTALPFVW